jgi:hypothetical protein
MDLPFMLREDFTKSIAALVALYPKEVNKTDTTGKKLKYTLWNATEPSKIEYMLNHVRIRHTLTAKERALIPSGTTSNEALHAEMKMWSSNTQGAHQAIVSHAANV